MGCGTHACAGVAQMLQYYSANSTGAVGVNGAGPSGYAAQVR